MSKILNGLLEKRAKAWNEMQALDTRALEGKRDMTADETRQWDEFDAEIGKHDVSIKREEKRVSLERRMAETSLPHESETTDKSTPESRASEAFETFLRSGVVNGRPAKSFDEYRDLQQDVDIKGGYTVPLEQFQAELIAAKDNQVFIRQKARKFQLVGAQSLGVPSRDTDLADATWTAEVGTITEDTDMTFGKRSFEPHQLTKLVKVSNKLIANSAIPITQEVQSRMAYKFGITEEQAFLTGNGAGQPLGLFTASTSGISTGQDVSTGNTTTSITFDGLIEAMYSLKGQYQAVGEWLFHRDALKQIRKLKDGEGQYLWQASTQAGQPDLILGKPLNMSEYVPNTFTAGLYVGMFADFSNYWIVDTLSMTMQRLNELYATTGEVGFISTMWVDGMPTLGEAFARVTLS